MIKYDERALLRQINGALKSCIDTHGPITREWVSSASKRILATAKEWCEDPDVLSSQDAKFWQDCYNDQRGKYLALQNNFEQRLAVALKRSLEKRGIRD